MGPQKFCYTFFHYNTCFLGSFRPIACKIGSLSSVIWLYHVKWELGVECVQSGALWNDSGRDKGPKNMVSVKCICSWEMRLRAIKLLSSYRYRSASFRPRSGMHSRPWFPIHLICSRIAHRETAQDTDALLGEDISPQNQFDKVNLISSGFT